MNLEYFIAKRLVSRKQANNTFSKPITAVAIGGIAIGMTIMILAIAIITGFKHEISQKLINFAAHIQIVNFENNNSYETSPIRENQYYFNSIKELDGVKSISPFIVKPGILKTEENLQGVVFKGITSNYNWEYFEQYMIEGETLTINDSIRTNDIVISKYLSEVLGIKLGDEIRAYFIQDPPRMRKFELTGIYDTQLEELDKLFIFADIKHLQKLNNWEKDQISGYEIYIEDFSKLTEFETKINNITGNNFTADGGLLEVKNIKEEFPGIFDWLSLLDINVIVILLLMTCVAGFNMISGLLVIILERVNMIGILKSIGAKNIQIEKVFIYVAAFLIGRGLIIGNVIGITFCVLQKQFGLIKLDAESYYVSTVPINLDIFHWLILNIGTLSITLIIMIFPALIISKISPSSTIKFD